MSPERTQERQEAKELFPENGSIEVITGCMFSGKTDQMVERLKMVKINLDIHVAQGHLTTDVANQVIKAFKPQLDKRYSSDKIDSHAQTSWPAIIVDENNPSQILDHLEENTMVVAIDEAQFFNPRLIDVCDEMADRGIRVIVAGLDTNFRGETFGLMGDLVARAEKKDQMRALCMKCGKKATRTQRVIVELDENEREIRRPANYDDPIVLVGAKEFYEARCRKHHEVPGKPERVLK